MENNMRKRDIKGKEINDISKEEILNDQEQDELIKKLRDQDNFLNNLFKVLLCVISFVSATYFYLLSPNSPLDVKANNISIISTSFAPIFVLLANESRIETFAFKAAFLAFFGFSLIPLLIAGLQVGVYCIPGILVLFDLIIIRDMHIIRKELGNLEKAKYDLKGA